MSDSLRPSVRPVDLSNPQSIHIVAIGGAGMSAIAQVLMAMGHTVSGSDLRDSSALQRITALGATTWVGHGADRIGPDVDIVARSAAIADDNVEVVHANDRGLAVYSRAEILRGITLTRRTLAISGTHGKTTTSSMLTVLLRHAGVDPSFIVGAPIAGIGTGAHWGDGDLLVLEADESDGSALVVDADACVVTSLDPDHLDRYGTVERFIEAFDLLLAGIAGPKVVCSDEAAGRDLAGRHDAVTYGLVEDDYVPDFALVDFVPSGVGSRFAIEVADPPSASGERRRFAIELSAPGLHNAKNATGAFAMALMIGIDPETAAAGLALYRGVARRFELRHAVGGITLIDDYAHLPAEVAAAVAAAADGDWNRVVAVFQPHRYTRTASLGDTFGGSFVGADEIVITDIYAANEKPIEGVSGRIVYDSVVAANPTGNVHYVPFDELSDWLVDHLHAGDLCLTMGAGDLTTIPDVVAPQLKAKAALDDGEGEAP